MENKKKIISFLSGYSEYFREKDISNLIKYSNDTDLVLIPSLHCPSTVFIVSFFFGYFGIDRMMIGDIWKGIGKLFFSFFLYWTIIVPLVIWIVDLFMIQGAVKDKNYNKVREMLL